MKIEKKILTKEQIEEMGIESWPIWSKEPSSFEWFYDSTEMAYILSGKVVVKTESEEIEINKGDFVVFPKGLNCTWNIIEKIRKHFNFE